MLLAVIITVLVPSCFALSLESFAGSDFIHLAKHGNQIYIGAVNRIYKLNTELRDVTDVSTGPKMDSTECTLPFAKCGETKSLSNTDNYNKILLVDANLDKLITCGSIFQGTCELRNLDDIGDSHSFRREMSQAVAANEPEPSTVAFIGPGDNGNMYVATTLTGVGLYTGRADTVPVFSIRKINAGNESFELAKEEFDAWFTKIKSKLSYEQAQAQNVDFVAGFHSSGYNYFLFTLLPEPESVRRSYIAQICQNDLFFKSYVEIPIECGIGFKHVQTAIVTPTKSGQDVLVASFTNSSSQTGRHSVVCMFRMVDIRSRVAENLQQCYDDSSIARGAHIEKITTTKCEAKTYTVQNDFCGEDDSNTPFSGGITLNANAIITSDSLITSIAVSSVSGSDVAFIGMSTGRIKKIFLSSRENGQEIEEMVIQKGSPILKDMVISNDGNHIFAMTASSLYKVPTHDCGRATDCETCRAMGDPYCGWCSLENKCSMRSECANEDISKRWISFEAWGCIEIKSINKRELSTKDGTQTVIVKIEELPTETNDNKYQCVFGSKVIDATVSGNGVSCQIKPSDMPTIPNEQDHIKQELAIKSTETGVLFLKDDVTFYDCSVHKECTGCARSDWGCEWCIHSHECISNEATCSSNSETLSNNEDCPRMLNSSEILIPHGVATSISLKAANLPVPRNGQSGYKCHVILGSPEQIVDAIRVSPSELQCESHVYLYDPARSTETANIQIKWNNNFEVEDRAVLQAVVYKCAVMGEDCSACSSLSETSDHAKYKCWWCDGMCKYEEKCDGEREFTCPKPNLNTISPRNGPKEGGTLLTIEGSNLGRNKNQVRHAVTIGGKSCPVRKYETSKRIVCEVPAGETDGQISVTISENTVAWEQHFVYKDPKPSKFTPQIGPQSGGTILTISGENLKTGANVAVIIGEVSTNLTCTVDPVHWALSTDKEMYCATPSVTALGPPGVVAMLFDGVRRDLPNVQEFQYVLDPVISEISPNVAYASGGRPLTVTGRHLNSVQTPKIFMVNSNGMESNTSDCKSVLSDQSGKMICSSPQASPSLRTKRDTDDDSYQLGFIMDGVASVRNVNNNFPSISSKLIIKDDPIYYEFVQQRRAYHGEALVLNGTNLNTGCAEDEVKVVIGYKLCEVKSLSFSQLLCTPPDDQPDGYPHKDSLPLVKVEVGNLKFELGSLEYVTPGGGLSEYMIIGVAVVGGILITVIIVILIIYKRKSTEAERQYKKMQIQLDTLESNVRNECKQAFAELQTEVSDFTSDLNVIGIPFWDYKVYTFKVLFPSHSDHPILHPDPKTYNKYGGYEEGFHQFNQLMSSKHFLLIFIRTLEQQKNFGIRDKAVVASLLMIVLHDKMEYATEILKALLNELVDKSVEKKHPKLMLRRTESVVEKLVTNWLSLCMYTYLKKHAGKTLFMLYKAIKHQTEKGPIDGITSEARYSLSEDRLLREKIEPKSLTILLRSDNDDGREPVSCKVLDCDTITQAKEKALDAIYMNTPHSKRPSVYDVDLMWQSGQRGHLPIKDEDVTTQVQGGWKRINTLAHYHVPDGANMSLVQSQTKNDMVREMHGMIEITSGTSLSAISPIITMEEGVKVYHLHKQDDNQNAPRSSGQKVISEIFLTRLLATKGTLQQYVDDLFSTILRADSTLTTAVKYLFDFLDNAARRHNIVDPEVVHTWKSNSLPLRFWVNIVKNPEFVFDVSKSHIVDSCLSVIAQTFMDSCSLSEHRLGKDSPSSKLLFAKDIPRYRKQVAQYYRNVQDMPPVSDRDMTQAMTELSMTNVTDFNVSVALKELYKYSMQYSFELIEALDEDPSARKMHLANRFEQVQSIIEGTQYY